MKYQMSNIRKNLYFDFSTDDLLIIEEVLPKKIGGIKTIWTLGFTDAAIHTVFDLGHLSLPVFSLEVFGGRTADHLRHSRTLIDLDIHSTRHAVTASSAEISLKIELILLNKGRDLISHDLRLRKHSAV